MYLIKKINSPKIEICKAVQDLLEKGLISIIYSNICPLCGNENVAKNINLKEKCSFCGEKYFINEWNEKYCINEDF